MERHQDKLNAVCDNVYFKKRGKQDYLEKNENA